ncbi:ROK family protein [Actinomyces gaoshouyii]|uniref:Transcriptional regulator n=1 Tax=Actinomyces gaoshouyii TaxID=1960083 RepID=A0A8H9HA04_9ACTO|nr:ROK family protein [Actinomyces gaoshouyii]GGO99364.1 transcriptional regulator [Actinomyces gaoshouyii]
MASTDASGAAPASDAPRATGGAGVHRPTGVVGLDLGGTKMAAALVGADGALLGPIASVPTPAHDGPAAMLDAIASLVVKVARTGIPGETADGPPTISAVGIGTAGVVDVERGEIVSATDAITDWAGTRVAEGVQARLEAEGLGRPPIHVENDVDAYAAGEAWLGAGRATHCALMVAVGTGVGGSVLLDGVPLRGAHHVAGEIGHMPSGLAAGETCTCGRPGHLEPIAAGPHILRRYLAAGGDPAAANAHDVEKRAQAGDELAARVYREAALALAQAIAGVATVLDPERVIISGGLARAGELWWAPLREAFASEVIEPLAGIEIVPAELGTTAPIIGAARGALALIG